ncbi:hypothetical protein G7046_g2967 [Stylonectria norvegica]|nr:hypothetical protein G7046_g2967 [Stylonectria norvegica]
MVAQTSVTLTGAFGKPVTVELGLFINNEFVEAKNGLTRPVENPSNGQLLAHIADAQDEDVDAAVNASKAAFDNGWKTSSPSKRGQLLNKLADLVERDADELASLEALDAGILFTESKGFHVAQAIETLRHFAGWSDKITGQLLQIPQGIAYTSREPLGVCAAIVPWNSPLMITCWKLAPAMAAGNTLIIKTPELAPLWGQKLASLVKEAGFPPGVINIICGSGAVAGQALAEHPLIRKIAFTGSTATGRKILKTSANSNLKKVTLELGGKGPSIVFADANLENALLWTSLGITANNGQICASGSRIYIHASIYESFLEAFKKRIGKAVQGDPLLPETTKGPLISNDQRKKVIDYSAAAKSSGIPSLSPSDALGHEGYFLDNTAFYDVPEDAAIMKEEIFGPVAAMAKFTTESEVIAKANDSEYGLSAAIFTNDVNRAHRVSAALESGQVTINGWGMISANVPFGGMKQSGFGRDMGEEALDGWLTTKSVKFNILPDAE